jgi:hypothetical protein
MKVFSPFLNGTTTTSGSFNVPNHPGTGSIPNPLTGSLFHDDTDGILKIYTGTQWQVVGEQALPVAGPASADIEYLLVAGGGGGGGGASTGGYTGGGGGGAGGYLSSSLASVESGSFFTVTIGAGGSGGPFTTTETDNKGTSGVNSSITGGSISTITSIGGGAGGAGGANSTGFGIGEDGGSGGGSGYRSLTAGSSTSGQGNDGGHGGSAEEGSGGGGGASQAGQDGFMVGSDNYWGGDGGSGSLSSITGTPTFYAGGGAAGGLTLSGYNTNTPGSGGPGGGGDGGGDAGLSGTAGTPNTGGGGGGGSRDESSNTGGSGGSGVAIFAYDSGSLNCAGGIVGDAGNGRKYNQFNTGGTFKVGSTSELQIVTNNLQLHLDAGNFSSRGTSTWTDLSGNGNNGTVTGATLGGDFFYTFNGSNNYITLPESAPANTSPHTVYGTFTGASETNWTLECWFKTSENDTDTWGTPIIGRDVSDLFAQLIVRNNYVQYMHADPSWQYVSSTSTVTDDNWHHVVLVNYSNATMDLWLDGTKEATGVDSTINYTDTRYFKLSHVARGYNGDYTACEVAQIRLYDTNLSAAEVLQNYNATKTNFV